MNDLQPNTLADADEVMENFDGLADGTFIENDAILARHIDWASTGANGGVWTEEIGRTTLGVAGDTISIASVATRKYTRLYIAVKAITNNISVALQFNGDTGNNYNNRSSANGGADSTATTQASILIGGQVAAGATIRCIVDITNVLGDEKTISFVTVESGAAGAGNATDRRIGSGKWADTSAAITRVDVINTAAGDYTITSEAVDTAHN